MLVRLDEPRAPLALSHTPEAATAAVLLLHGGRERGTDAPPRWNLPDLRMRPFARAIRRAAGDRGAAVGRVRYRCRGWNGAREDPAQDARQALDQLAAHFGDIPTVLVGHSMGGRAALRVADHRLVRAVVGLAPWCPPGEPVAHLRGRSVVLLHGDRDRTTDPAASADFAARAQAAGVAAATVLMPGAGHAMLRRAGSWHGLTTEVVTGLLGIASLPAVADPAAAPRRRTFPECWPGPFGQFSPQHQSDGRRAPNHK
ncbi:alpha/beta fold hydrolase [Streptomyces boninensis]|uniref:alpha/beta fold hydrolase n=1 Tax=Streptomyces boninensis TaxID=2039455 RepID=UPI003B21F94C